MEPIYYCIDNTVIYCLDHSRLSEFKRLNNPKIQDTNLIRFQSFAFNFHDCRQD